MAVSEEKKYLRLGQKIQDYSKGGVKYRGHKNNLNTQDIRTMSQEQHLFFIRKPTIKPFRLNVEIKPFRVEYEYKHVHHGDANNHMATPFFL